MRAEWRLSRPALTSGQSEMSPRITKGSCAPFSRASTSSTCSSATCVSEGTTPASAMAHSLVLAIDQRGDVGQRGYRHENRHQMPGSVKFRDSPVLQRSEFLLVD